MTKPPRRRVLQMALVWAFIGQWVGADIGMRAGGLVGSIAGAVAVMAEMAVLGAFLGWIGGRPRDTIIGAVLGLIAGVALAPLTGHADLLSRANMGLIAGASDGATLRPYLRMIWRVLGAATRRLGWTFAGIRLDAHGDDATRHDSLGEDIPGLLQLSEIVGDRPSVAVP